MKIVVPRKQALEGKVWSGKVRVTIQAIATDGLMMTAVNGMPGRSMTLKGTTVEELFELFYSVVKDVTEAGQ